MWRGRRLSELFEVKFIPLDTWIVLCKRVIKGKSDQINQKKAIYFNNQMIKFSEKLMLKLYREAIIN